MLVHLHVKNLALIQEAQADFGPGLNILTGETGAGKSILMGSVNLALGQKMSRGMIREGASYALVELVFQVDAPTEEKLKELEVFPEDGQVIITRRLMENRSISKVNGETTTAANIRKIASLLLDIHGQHEHQSLLYPEKQMEILDGFGGLEIQDKKEKVKELYREYSRLKKELEGYGIDEEQRRREMGFLEYEIREISRLSLEKVKTRSWKLLTGSCPTVKRSQKALDLYTRSPDMRERAWGPRWEGRSRSCPRSGNMTASWKIFTVLWKIWTVCSMT